jgi:putative transposase
MRRGRLSSRVSLRRLRFTRSINKYYYKYNETLGVNAQEVIRKNGEAWKAFFELLKLNWKDRFTGRKEMHIFIRSDRYHLEPIDENGGYLVLEDFGLRIRYAGRIKWKGKQGRLEIVYVNGKWFAYVPIDVGRELPKPIRRAMLSLTTRIGRVGL